METHVSTSQIFWPYLWNPIFMKNMHAIETNGSGCLVLLFLSSVPQMEGQPVEVNVLQRKCHRGLVFKPRQRCRFLLWAHDNQPHKERHESQSILAPPDADLPSPEPEENPSFSPWVIMWSTKPGTRGGQRDVWTGHPFSHRTCLSSPTVCCLYPECTWCYFPHRSILGWP